MDYVFVLLMTYSLWIMLLPWWAVETFAEGKSGRVEKCLYLCLWCSAGVTNSREVAGKGQQKRRFWMVVAHNSSCRTHSYSLEAATVPSTHEFIPHFPNLSLLYFFMRILWSHHFFLTNLWKLFTVQFSTSLYWDPNTLLSIHFKNAQDMVLI